MKPSLIVVLIFLICSCNRKIIEPNNIYIYNNEQDTSVIKKLNEIKITFLNDYCYVYEMHYYGCSYHRAKYIKIFNNIILFKMNTAGINCYYTFNEAYNPKIKDSILIRSTWICKGDTFQFPNIDLILYSDFITKYKTNGKGILLLKNDIRINKIIVNKWNIITEFQTKIPNSNDISINYFPGTDTICNYLSLIKHKIKIQENYLVVKSDKKKYFLKKLHTRN